MQLKCETSKGTSVLHNHLKDDSCKRTRSAIEQHQTLQGTTYLEDPCRIHILALAHLQNRIMISCG
ncbi:hypothetical protein HU200_013276 [Digitaria exilis]|uniref:Uncharacterized protein n=1 Tax=Digitaria exilis TaxID=1010633 RepID=A0A835FDN5_9POAL|nr:hypothetical protein HU200_013276 [Digitaria exilis]